MGGPERIPRSDTEQYGAGGKEDEGEHETKSGGLATQHPRAVRKVVSCVARWLDLAMRLYR